MDSKVCSKCKKEKPVSEFGKRNNTKCGCVSRCKKCMSEDRKNLPAFFERESFILKRGNCCEVCGISREISIKVLGRDLCIDHCHKTGKLCGILCNLCNVAAGGVKDNPNLAYKLWKYLERTRKDS